MASIQERISRETSSLNSSEMGEIQRSVALTFSLWVLVPECGYPYHRGWRLRLTSVCHPCS